MIRKVSRRKVRKQLLEKYLKACIEKNVDNLSKEFPVRCIRARIPYFHFFPCNIKRDIIGINIAFCKYVCHVTEVCNVKLLDKFIL
jgi:hypothetical protein